MQLVEKLGQYGFDFQAVLTCEHCGSSQFMDNGYEDERFLYQVIPAIKCLSCEKRSVEVIPPGIGDPGYQFGFLVHKIPVEVMKWVKK